jgi:hypothetical protein
MRCSVDRRALVTLTLVSSLLAGCEVDACREGEASILDTAALSGPDLARKDARCTRGDTLDGCPIEECDASCPEYTNAGRSTVSVEPVGCRLDRPTAELVCAYRVIYDVCHRPL